MINYSEVLQQVEKNLVTSSVFITHLIQGGNMQAIEDELMYMLRLVELLRNQDGTLTRLQFIMKERTTREHPEQELQAAINERAREG